MNAWAGSFLHSYIISWTSSSDWFFSLTLYYFFFLYLKTFLFIVLTSNFFQFYSPCNLLISVCQGFWACYPSITSLRLTEKFSMSSLITRFIHSLSDPNIIISIIIPRPLYQNFFLPIFSLFIFLLAAIINCLDFVCSYVLCLYVFMFLCPVFNFLSLMDKYI